MSHTVKTLLIDSGIVERIQRGRISGQVGLTDRDATDALARIQGAVETARKDAVARTVDAVQAENEMKEGRAAKTNGQRRGNEPPTPDSTRVESASQTQYDNIIDLVRDEVMHETSVKEKAERLEFKPRRRRR